MKIINEIIRLNTKGSPDLINITDKLSSLLEACGLKQGNLTIFIIGSTAALATFEYEPGLIQDIQELYEKIIPSGRHYHHDDTWGDANGYSHLRAALQGPSLVIPFKEARLQLGTWQQVVLAEFDNQPRQRQIVVQIIGQ